MKTWIIKKLSIFAVFMLLHSLDYSFSIFPSYNQYFCPLWFFTGYANLFSLTSSSFIAVQLKRKLAYTYFTTFRQSASSVSLCLCSFIVYSKVQWRTSIVCLPLCALWLTRTFVTYATLCARNWCSLLNINLRGLETEMFLSVMVIYCRVVLWFLKHELVNIYSRFKLSKYSYEVFCGLLGFSFIKFV